MSDKIAMRKIFSIIILVNMFAACLAFFVSGCKHEREQQHVQEKISVASAIAKTPTTDSYANMPQFVPFPAEWNVQYMNVTVSGMRYFYIYSGHGAVVINVTKDSLEIVNLKKEIGS